jgi:hypothetical protein
MRTSAASSTGDAVAWFRYLCDFPLNAFVSDGFQ